MFNTSNTLNIIQKIKSFFKSEVEEPKQTADFIFKDEEIDEDTVCSKCNLYTLCNKKRNYTCGAVTENEAELLKKIDLSKDTILIIDDNEGIVSFLKDDMDYFIEKGIIDKDINILTISGQHAAFTLESYLNHVDNLKIKYAIIDITLGGSKMTPVGNMKYTGVDVFEMLHKRYPRMRFLFYTGNNLNPYIKSNSKLIKQFKLITSDDIKNHVLFKTSMDINTRREYIQDKIFPKKIKR